MSEGSEGQNKPELASRYVGILPWLLVPLSLYCLAYHYLNTSWAVDQTESILESQFAGRFEVDRFIISPLFDSVRIYRPHIQTEAGEDVIEATQVNSSIELGALPGNLLLVDETTVYGADVHHRLGEAGLDVARIFAPPGPAEPPDAEESRSDFKVVLDNIEVHRSQFEFDGGFFDFRVDNIGLRDGYLSIGPSGLLMKVGQLTSKKGDFRFDWQLVGGTPKSGDWTFDYKDVRLEGWRWGGQQFSIDEFGAEVDGLELLTRGQMGFPGAVLGPDRGDWMTYRGVGALGISYWSDIGQYFLRDYVHFHGSDIEVATEGSLQYVDVLADIGLEYMEVAGFDFHNVEAEGVLENEWIWLESFRADAYGGQVTAENGFFNMYTLEYGGDVSLSTISLQAFFEELGLPVWNPIAGSVSGGVRVAGAIPSLQLEPTGHHPYRSIEYATRKYADLKVASPLELERHNVTAFPGRKIGLGEQTRLRVGTDHIDLVRADVSIGRDRLELQGVSYNYAEGTVGKSPLQPLNVAVRIGAVGPWFEALGLPAAKGAATGRFRMETVRGQRRASLTVDKGASDWSLAGLERSISELSVDIQWRDRRARVNRFEVESGETRLFVSGSVTMPDIGWRDRYLSSDQIAQLTEMDAYSVDLHGGLRRYDFDTAAIRALSSGPRVRADIEGDVRVSGPLTRPTASLEGTIGQIELAGAALEELNVRVGYDDRRATLEALKVEGLGGQLLMSGMYDVAGDFRASLKLDNLNLERAGFIRDLTRLSDLRGRLTGELHGSGTIDTPHVGGFITLRDGSFNGFGLGDASLVTTTEGGAIQLQGAVLPNFGLELMLPMNASEEVSARVRFKNLDVGRYFPALKKRGRIESTALTGQVGFQTNYGFDNYTLEGRLTDVRASFGNRRLRNREPIAFEVVPGERLELEDTVLSIDDHRLALSGAVFFDPFRYKVEARGRVDLGLFNSFKQMFPELAPPAVLEANGFARIDLEVSGDATSIPKASGRISFDEAAVSLRMLSDPVQLNSGVIELDSEQLRIPTGEPLRGRILGGQFRVIGESVLEDGLPGRADFEVRMYNARYRVASMANFAFDSRVRIRADQLLDLGTWKVTGDLNLLDALVYQDVNVLQQQVTGRVVGIFRRTADRYHTSLLEQLPELKQMQFDLNVRAQDSLRVDNQIERLGMNLELRADLELTGALADPSLDGTLKVIRGQIAFQGEEFDVRDGTLTFSGAPWNPWADVVAGADIVNRCREQQANQKFGTDLDLMSARQGRGDNQVYHVTLNAQGRPSDLNLEFNSIPYADRRDVLSLLLTGCTVDQLSASRAGGPTLEIALAPLLGQLETEVKDAVRVSEFRIMPGIERTQVQIGDRLTRRLSWNFRLDAGMAASQGGQEATLVYKLTDQWSLELSERGQRIGDSAQTQANRYLLDLRLKYRVPLE